MSGQDEMLPLELPGHEEKAIELVEEKLPGPGRYPDLPAKYYHSLPYVSNSYLSRFASVPAAVNVQPETTPSQAFGSALHCLVLEPGKFADEYAVAPACDRRTKEGKKVHEEFVAASAGKSVITLAELETLRAVRDSVFKHPWASKLLADGTAEQTFIWQDSNTGLMCKARVDWEPAGGRGLFVDLKTTKSAEMRPFLNSIVSYGYYRQAAMYLWAANIITNELLYDRFCFIAVETAPPYRVEVYTLGQSFIRQGFLEFKNLIRQEKKCRDAGFYPHYKNAEIIEIEKPAYLIEPVGIN